MIYKVFITTLFIILCVYSYLILHKQENTYNIDNKYIWPCSYIFNIYEYSLCADVVEYYYKQEPQYYEKTITYYNLMPELNYTEFEECVLNNNIILVVKYLNYSLMDSFWIITNI
jgi:hypothetical protein